MLNFMLEKGIIYRDENNEIKPCIKNPQPFDFSKSKPLSLEQLVKNMKRTMELEDEEEELEEELDDEEGVEE